MPGPQYQLDHDGVHLEVAALAAALRVLRVGGVDLTEPYAADRVAPMGCGLVLAPWPNRVRDGRWALDGEPQQFDITEPPFHNASHGLLRNVVYEPVEQTEASLTLRALIPPQHGWPFLLDTRVRYELESDGLSVTHTVVNRSGRDAVWAVGAHPYLRVGAVPVDDLTVTVTGAVRLDLDERFLPVGVRAVGGDGDLRSGRPVRGLDLNTGYGQLANRDGRADVAWLTAPDGASTTLWADQEFGWIQAYTPSAFPREAAGPEATGTAVALEPMTAPPDALNSGTDLIHLAPGAVWEAGWGIRYAAAGGDR